MTWFDNIMSFYRSLSDHPPVPDEVVVMNPYQEEESMDVAEKFYQKYYSDSDTRVFLIGINPGRFGGGITGVPFTDPLQLEQHCGIKNHLDKKQELSSRFVYHMIAQYGGPAEFYRNYFITAVSPLGFIKDGKNLNYYDIKELQQHWEGFFVQCMEKQLNMGGNREVAYSMGQGKNIKYLHYLNNKYGFFKQIKALPHPRWIMQYRLKRLDEFTNVYLDELKN